jgi:diadenosine tetraphosphate (Ap4A) HIT family hydrolase
MSDGVVGLMHIIPRYRGDAENPRGGIRGVIPGKKEY